MTEISRRGFVAGCSAGIAALSGSRFKTLAFAGGPQEGDVLVVLFLRGGMDGLSLVPPLEGADRRWYEQARPDLRIPTRGPGSALDLNGAFGLHPAARPLYELWEDGQLALVQGVGQTVANRSHFDAMQFLELGTPGQKSVTSGWLARFLATADNLPVDGLVPSLSVGSLQTLSLLGSYETVNLSDIGSFRLDTGPWRWQPSQRTALRRLYQQGSSWLHDSGVQALNALDVVELNGESDYRPARGATYPESEFGEHLKIVAQLIKLDLGLSVATLDLGGWDTHNQQGFGSEGYFAALVGELAQGLGAFYEDLSAGSDATKRLTVVVQSEFGRRFQQNGDSGTDHGHGNVMMLLGGGVRGGLHGTFPGLHLDQLFEGDDLAVTTDYRQVLTEIVLKRMGNPHIDRIFPDYEGYVPLNVVEGEEPEASGLEGQFLP